MEDKLFYIPNDDKQNGHFCVYKFLFGKLKTTLNQTINQNLSIRSLNFEYWAGSLNHFSGDPDRGEPSFSQSQRGIT